MSIECRSAIVRRISSLADSEAGIRLSSWRVTNAFNARRRVRISSFVKFTSCIFPSEFRWFDDRRRPQD